MTEESVCRSVGSRRKARRKNVPTWRTFCLAATAGLLFDAVSTSVVGPVRGQERHTRLRNSLLPAVDAVTDDRFDYTRQPFAQTIWNPLVGRLENKYDPKEIPQFVVLSVDNAINRIDASHIFEVARIRQAHVNGCDPAVKDGRNRYTEKESDEDEIEISSTPIRDVDDPRSPKDYSAVPLTLFVSVFGSATQETPYLDCDMVRAFYRGGSEIGTHTYRDTPNPSVREILNAIDYVSGVCGIPVEDLRGFRAPAPINNGGNTPVRLRLDEELLNNIRSALQITYDSTLEAYEGPQDGNGRSHFWPFTMHNGIPPVYGTFRDDFSRPYPGVWEFPMYPLVLPRNGGKTMYDPNPTIARPSPLFTENLRLRLEGNRAPLGIYMSPTWLAANKQLLIEWIEGVIEDYPNLVYFVTYSQVLDYIKHPVRLQNYRPPHICRNDLSDDVPTEEDLYPIFPGCMPPFPDGCVNGRWDHDFCKCRCFDDFCRDIFGEVQVGTCTVFCATLPGGGEKGPDGDENPDNQIPEEVVDGQWGDWTEWSVCFRDRQTRFRSCNDPPPGPGGADCTGEAIQERQCEEDSEDSSAGWMLTSNGIIGTAVVAAAAVPALVSMLVNVVIAD